MTRTKIPDISDFNKKRPKLSSDLDEFQCVLKKSRVDDNSGSQVAKSMTNNISTSNVTCLQKNEKITTDDNSFGTCNHGDMKFSQEDEIDAGTIKKVNLSRDYKYCKKYFSSHRQQKCQNTYPQIHMNQKYVHGSCIYCNKKNNCSEIDIVQLNCELSNDYILTTEEEILCLNLQNNSFELFNFNIYDPNGHLCPLTKFDTDGTVLLISGTVVYNDMHLIDHIGPIINWKIISNYIVVINTKQIEFFASYPKKDYESYYEEAIVKTTLKNHFINYLENIKVSVSIARMKSDVIRSSNNLITMEHIQSNLKFIIREIWKWYRSLEYSKKILMEKFECIQLIKDVMEESNVQIKTFTPLVQDMIYLMEFRKFQNNANMCGICDGCKQPSCKKCKICKSNLRKTKICDKIKCKNASIVIDPIKYNKYSVKKHSLKKQTVLEEKAFFNEANIGSTTLKNKDFVMIKSNDSDCLILQIVYMWHSKIDDEFYFHGQNFIKGFDTILGEFSNSKEIFLINKCSDKIPFHSILSKIKVILVNPTKLNSRSSSDRANKCYRNDCDYFYSKFYNAIDGSFTDIPKISLLSTSFKHCDACLKLSKELREEVPNVVYSSDKFSKNFGLVSIRWKNHKYAVGDGVFFKSKTSNFEDVECDNIAPVNNNIYTEMYRKPSTSCKKNALPYSVGIIHSIKSMKSIFIDPKNIYFVVNILHRPENTDSPNSQCEDLNSLYWGNIKKEINLTEIIEPVDLIYKENIPNGVSLQEWSNDNPNSFYINGAYDVKTSKIVSAPLMVKNLGKRCETQSFKNRSVSNSPRKLRGLEVFGGCGGFSLGITLSNAVEFNWVIENDLEAARSYQINYPNCNVIKQEANCFLQKLIEDRGKSSDMPKPNEIEFLMCSPPCQGFSILNRFKDREYSSLQNSLIYTSLSYFDYFRPNYFLLENVKNIVTHENGSTIQIFLRFLLECGYQCRFSVLQAGNFGVPQNRRRFFIWAAAPGLNLPNFPNPTHSFNHPTSLSVTLNGITIGLPEQYSAPRRACTIYDAIGDLPKMENLSSNLYTIYKRKPLTQYQRIMRQENLLWLLDHMSKPLDLLNEARVTRIPVNPPGCDWRNLPNVSVKLSDGRIILPLKYEYLDADGVKRGICPCINKQTCSVTSTKLSLIPWFLAHTADKNNHWEGVIGRLDFDGHFKTTLTNPNILGKQGRVIHPNQNRIVSIRECARSQGFPDDFVFTGNLESKYKQVGNAVPPPLALAIGKELLHALKQSEIVDQ